MEMIYSRFVNIYDSSNISQIAYNTKTRAMQITFRTADGIETKYSYTNVSSDIFGTVVASNSIGSTVNALIVKKFKGTKV